LTGVSLDGESPVAIARHAALGTGVSMAALAFMEIGRAKENLLRSDLVCMGALYYLLFFEFLLPQPDFDVVSENREVVQAVNLVLWSLAAMAIGRHFVGRRVKRWSLAEIQLSPKSLIVLFWFCFAAGYLYMLASVNFNPLEMVWYFLDSRFGQPWSRTQYGDLQALLYELGAVLYLVPPIAGIILGNRSAYSRVNVVMVLLAFLFTLFYGFSGGTRSILVTYLITFVVAYYYASGCAIREIVFVAGLAGAMTIASTVYGLEFRRIGLADYLSQDQSTEEAGKPGFFVDYNLFTLSQLVSVFPVPKPYLGWEVPEWILVRVVPRALWPGKPDGTKVSPQTYLDIAEGTTLSSTFIGEGYMCAGPLGAVALAFGLGCLGSWWTKKAFAIHSDFGIVLYGSGFFALATAMRSIYMLPVALMPVLALTVMVRILARRRANQSKLSHQNAGLG
jgi:hypothetical protein